MKQQLALVAVVVRDYDEAIAWYSRCLAWNLVEDTDMGNGKRWVVMKPPGGDGTTDQGAGLLLARGVTPTQLASVGNQTGGRVFLFLHTDDFQRDYQRMVKEGVVFLGEPRQEPYGQVVVFSDLYGNKWDLIEPGK